jgi:hypothetical protein
MGKLSFIAGLAAGYVLGAKAGQKRYQQIKSQADKVWSSDPVQARVGTVKETVVQTVRDQAPVVAAKIGDVARTAGASAKERLTGEDLPESLHRGTDGRLHADTNGYGPGADKLP